MLQILCNEDSTIIPSNNNDTARSRCHNIKSNIISSKVDKEKITEWLASAGKTSEPKLLYRASRDGWSASDFHRMCDGKGATVTVVKSSGGYIFGGYTDVAWSGEAEDSHEDSNDVVQVFKSSTESFLFSLKDHEGIGPVKMPIKSDKTGRAVCHHSSYGPCFGSGDDLRLASNANAANTESYCDVGKTYQLPPKVDTKLK